MSGRSSASWTSRSRIVVCKLSRVLGILRTRVPAISVAANLPPAEPAINDQFCMLSYHVSRM